jgi:hypothetical protein
MEIGCASSATPRLRINQVGPQTSRAGGKVGHFKYLLLTRVFVALLHTHGNGRVCGGPLLFPSSLQKLLLRAPCSIFF